MKQHFHFSRLDCILLVGHLVTFGGCLVLLILKGANVPIVLLTLGAALGVIAKLGSSYRRSSTSPSSSNADPAIPATDS
jgi:hypothetical protein